MRTPHALLAAVAVGSLIAAGAAFAANNAASTSTPQSAVQKDFAKLSADGSRAFQDLTLTRLAIYDGDTAKAKTLIDQADTAFTKAKSDDAVFTKAEGDLMTPQQMAAKQQADQAKASGKAQTPPVAASAAPTTSESAKPIAWLPVDAAISLDEDYTANPAKAKAVADANTSLSKGDAKGALEKLKLADVDMSVAIEVVPLQTTIADVHQAASLIDSGKYYEGSQALRKVQTSARFDVANYVATPGGKVSASHASDVGAPATH